MPSANMGGDAQNVALVGLGHVAAHHIAAIAATPGLQLVVACDLKTGKRSIVPPEIEFTDNLDEVIAHTGVDLVVVAVPPSVQVDVGLAVVRAGRSLAIEKPLALSRQAYTELTTEVRAARGAGFHMLLHAAYGLETVWFVEAIGREDEATSDLGPVHGFACHFYDPYVESGRCHAVSLGGSWIDSAINALSVLDRFVNVGSFEVEHSAMLRLDGIPADQIQGSATFSFRASDGTLGRGIVDTNWCLGVNRKLTRLFFKHGAVEIRLDHTDETVKRLDQGHAGKTLASLNAGLPRLTSHYLGVFADVAAAPAVTTQAIDSAERLHDPVYSALELSPGFC